MFILLVPCEASFAKIVFSMQDLALRKLYSVFKTYFCENCIKYSRPSFAKIIQSTAKTEKATAIKD